MTKYILLAPLLAVPMLTIAQTNDESSSSDFKEIEKIEVTGRVSKFDVPLSETPQAISIIDASDFELKGAISVEEALRYTPSVQAELSGRQGFDDFLIRGFTQSRFQFRDGLRLDPGFLQQQEAYGLSSIEVLKGPASVLYGQIAPGGLVNLNSKIASADAIKEVGIQAGSYGLLRAFADVGGSISDDDSWSVRAPIVISTAGNVQDSVDAERQFIAPSITWAPSDDTQLTFLSVYQRDEYDRVIGFPFEGTLRPNPNGEIPQSRFLGEPEIEPLESEQFQVGYQLRHAFSSSLTFRSSMRYSDFELNGPIVQAPRPGSTTEVINRRGFEYLADRDLFAIDNQIEGVIESDSIEHRFVIGADHQKYNDEQSGDLFGLAPISLFNPQYGAQPEPIGPFFEINNELEELGVYSQYRAKINDKFIAVAGLRYSDVENTAFAPDGSVSRKQPDDEVTFNGAFMYLAENNLTPYISYAESFQPQVGNDPLLNGDTPPPSLGEQIELGLRWMNDNNSIALNAAVYRLDQTNIVNGDPNNPGFSVLVGEQRHTGFELDITGQANKYLQLQLGYAYLDAEITRSNNGDEGLTPVTVPEHAISGFATLEGEALGLENFLFLGGARYVGDRRANGSGDTLPSYTVVDLGINYQVKRYIFQFNLKNIFDERFFTTGERFVIDGEPRVAQITFTTSF
ncbi:TonB-dependent siderophore receptor [Glaciecola siphonariae]|uniref:TonB-dependent siderophore receptor n=1 Tax=Glaciecola siphonariae TaxID=521012 RepID=A0ABV9LR64_9ALTE